MQTSPHHETARARTAPVNTMAAFEVVPSGAAVGAEIRGIDLSQPVPEDVKEALRKAWADHMVLLIRGQKIDDDQLEAASLIFGPPHEPASRKYHVDAGHAVGGGNGGASGFQQMIPVAYGSSRGPRPSASRAGGPETGGNVATENVGGGCARRRALA